MGYCYFWMYGYGDSEDQAYNNQAPSQTHSEAQAYHSNFPIVQYMPLFFSHLYHIDKYFSALIVHRLEAVLVRLYIRTIFLRFYLQEFYTPIRPLGRDLFSLPAEICTAERN